MRRLSKPRIRLFNDGGARVKVFTSNSEISTFIPAKELSWKAVQDFVKRNS